MVHRFDFRLGYSDMLGTKHWKIAQPDVEMDDSFVQSVPASRILSRVLWNRGIRTPDQVRRYLNPSMSNLHDPGLLDGMEIAVERTRRAIGSGEKIMIHGDYDVDGITSTALLVRVLTAIGADVNWYVPHRQREGYDLRSPAIEVARERGVGLIITADCGTSAFEAADLARSYGMDVIVTDHHEPGDHIAEVLALINPRKPGCPYPFKDLAGVGVAFKFAEALVRESGYDVDAYRGRFMDIVAIGTVADIVPLLDENRVLVKYGIEEIPRSGKRGVRALLERSGLAGKPITSQNLAFVLGPRLNAAGRLDDASLAVDLLLTRDDAEAASIADALEACNRARQTEQSRILQEAVDQIETKRLIETARVLVLSSTGWHPGVVGIVAGKLAETYSRPTIMIALDETGQTGVGSARSIAEFDMLEALVECGGLLDRFGGHSKAAGLSISTCNLGEFDCAINRVADAILAECDLVPHVEVDAEIDLESITQDLVSELNLLEPYGHCNREPVFMTRNASVQHKNTMGATNAHLKLKLGIPAGRTVDCVGFGWGPAEQSIRLGSMLDTCYNARLNDYNGRRNVQLILRDARVSEDRMGDVLPSEYA